jgi:hypothetical protein
LSETLLVRRDLVRRVIALDPVIDQALGDSSDLCPMSAASPAALTSRTDSRIRGLASVNPIFTWVRLAQRVPVRIHVDHVPDGVRLVAGMTASVQIDPHPRPRPP